MCPFVVNAKIRTNKTKRSHSSISSEDRDAAAAERKEILRKGTNPHTKSPFARFHLFLLLLLLLLLSLFMRPFPQHLHLLGHRPIRPKESRETLGKGLLAFFSKEALQSLAVRGALPCNPNRAVGRDEPCRNGISQHLHTPETGGRGICDRRFCFRLTGV